MTIDVSTSMTADPLAMGVKPTRSAKNGMRVNPDAQQVPGDIFQDDFPFSEALGAASLRGKRRTPNPEVPGSATPEPSAGKLKEAPGTFGRPAASDAQAFVAVASQLPAESQLARPNLEKRGSMKGDPNVIGSTPDGPQRGGRSRHEALSRTERPVSPGVSTLIPSDAAGRPQSSTLSTSTPANTKTRGTSTSSDRVGAGPLRALGDPPPPASTQRVSDVRIGGEGAERPDSVRISRTATSDTFREMLRTFGSSSGSTPTSSSAVSMLSGATWMTSISTPSVVISAASSSMPAAPAVQVSAHIIAMHQRDVTQATVTLNPESLGKVDVMLRVSSSGVVDATVVAQSSAAAQILAQSLDALRVQLEQSGVAVGDLNVDRHDAYDLQKDSDHRPSDQSSSFYRPGVPTSEVDLTVHVPVHVTQQVVTERRINLLA